MAHRGKCGANPSLRGRLRPRAVHSAIVTRNAALAKRKLGGGGEFPGVVEESEHGMNFVAGEYGGRATAVGGSDVKRDVWFELGVEARVDDCEHLIEEFLGRCPDAFEHSCPKLDRFQLLAHHETG